LIIAVGNGTVVGMGRKRTQLTLTPTQRTQLTQQLQAATEARQKERLRFALLAAEGRQTLEELAGRLGRARSTLQRNFQLI
jgi:predicted transcriptional regulator